MHKISLRCIALVGRKKATKRTQEPTLQSLWWYWGIKYGFWQCKMLLCLKDSNIIKNFLSFFFLLYNIVLVLPCINMHPPRVYTCSPSWNPLPPPSPYHPSGSSQCTSPKLTVSCIEPGLAIHFLYDIIHVWMPFSQIIPPPLSHRVQKTVQYICVSLAVSHTGLSLPFF